MSMRHLPIDSPEQAFILFNALLSHKDRRVEIHIRTIERYEKNGEPWDGAIAEQRAQLNKFMDAYGSIEQRLREMTKELLV